MRLRSLSVLSYSGQEGSNDHTTKRICLPSILLEVIREPLSIRIEARQCSVSLFSRGRQKNVRIAEGSRLDGSFWCLMSLLPSLDPQLAKAAQPAEQPSQLLITVLVTLQIRGQRSSQIEVVVAGGLSSFAIFAINTSTVAVLWWLLRLTRRWSL